MNTSITELHLAGTLLDGDPIISLLNILDILRTNSRINYVDLSQNYLRDDSIKHISNFIRSNTSITFLNLSENLFNMRGFSYLYNALHANHTLTQFHVSKNSCPNWAYDILRNIILKKRPKLS